MPATTRVVDLIVRWQELREQGQTVTAEELCADAPDLLAEFRQRLQELASLASMLNTPTPTQEPGNNSAVTPYAHTPGTHATPVMIPGYEILGELGRGGMGVVYKARQLNLDRHVALKMLRIDAAAHVDSLRRFRQEATTVARLQHPNIVQIYDIGETSGAPYLSLEYVDGGSLAGFLKKGSLAIPDVMHLTVTLADALHHAHERGVIHRDLKPANILQTASGRPKVADFGLARLLDADKHISRSGLVVGTPHYMSPEQASGSTQDIGPATDIYALGVILYELLTGTRPFEGDNALAILDQVRFGKLLPPRKLRGDIPEDLNHICVTCLTKDPAERWDSAGVIAQMIREIMAAKRALDMQMDLFNQIVNNQVKNRWPGFGAPPMAAAPQPVAAPKAPAAAAALASREPVEIDVVHGDITKFAADMIALKFAGGLVGAARAVADCLEISEASLRNSLRLPGDHCFVRAEKGIAAPQVLFAATPDTSQLGYADIKQFGFHVLKTLCAEASSIQRLALTMHGVNMGLDEREALACLVAGCISALLSGKAPPTLEKIAIVELNEARAKRLHDHLELWFPESMAPTTADAKIPAATAAMPDVLRSCFSLAAIVPNKPLLLAAFPPTEEFDDMYHYAVEPAVQAAGYLCERADTRMSSAATLAQIQKRIDSADFVLCDLSGASPNVLLLLGFAWGRQRPTLLLARDPKEIPAEAPPEKCLHYRRIREVETFLKKVLATK